MDFNLVSYQIKPLVPGPRLGNLILGDGNSHTVLTGSGDRSAVASRLLTEYEWLWTFIQIYSRQMKSCFQYQQLAFHLIQEILQVTDNLQMGLLIEIPNTLSRTQYLALTFTYIRLNNPRSSTARKLQNHSQKLLSDSNKIINWGEKLFYILIK